MKKVFLSLLVALAVGSSVHAQLSRQELRSRQLAKSQSMEKVQLSTRTLPKQPLKRGLRSLPTAGDTITLDLSKPQNPASFTYNGKNAWAETYNYKDYPYVELNDAASTMSFSHKSWVFDLYSYYYTEYVLEDYMDEAELDEFMDDMYLGDGYWDGFTVSKNGDDTKQANFIADQWGNMAGGGIKTDVNGKVLKDGNGRVQVDKDIPYLVGYDGGGAGGFYGATTPPMQTLLYDAYKAVGMYVNAAPWAYYSVRDGDAIARPLNQEGDYFKLLIYGLDETYEVDKSKVVEYMLAEYKNDSLYQSADWEYVDLTKLGVVYGLSYAMESTDMSGEYMNTPAYFCMDKLQVKVPKPSDVTINLSSYSYKSYGIDTTFIVLKNKATDEEFRAGEIGKNTGKNTYTLEAVPYGDYVLEAYTTNSKDETSLNGAMDLTIADDEKQTFNLFLVQTEAYNDNLTWKLNTDFTVSYTVKSAAGISRNAKAGMTNHTNGYGGEVSCIVLSGDSCIITLTPSASRISEGYEAFTERKKVTSTYKGSSTLPNYRCLITVPEGATVFVGKKGYIHFVPFAEQQPTGVATANGSTTYTFSLADGEYNYRVSQPGKVTRASVFSKSGAYADTITSAMLEGNPKAVNRNVQSNNGYNQADVLLNVNEKGHLKLEKVNDTLQLVNLRVWQLTNSSTMNYFLEPDFHYTVVNESGQADNTVATVDKNGVVRAVGSGTAMVLVTYDAINVPSAMGGSFWGALWAENTGVFVVSVGAATSGITPNMTINEAMNPTSDNGKLAATAVDAEHDIFYYLKEKGGYDYTFKPEGVTSVLLAQPTLDTAGENNALSYSGFSANGVTANADGSYTVRLTFGRNIVKLISAGGAEYQVLSAKPVSYTLSNFTHPNEEISAGDSLLITFSTLYHPANKLAGIYNMAAGIQYTSIRESKFNAVGGVGQYTFASKAQTYGVRVPADFTGDEFVLDSGVIKVYGFGSHFGQHRDITLDKGAAPNMNALIRQAYFGALPNVYIPVKDTTAPSIPANLAGKTTASTITLSWSPSTDNGKVAGYKVYVDGTLVATVTDTAYKLSELTALTSYFIEVEAVDGKGNASEKASITVTTNEKPVTAIFAAQQTTVRIYPNPVANGELKAENGEWKEGEKVEIYSLSGALVLTQPTAGETTSVNVSALPNGTYVLKVGRGTAKFVKQ